MTSNSPNILCRDRFDSVARARPLRQLQDAALPPAPYGIPSPGPPRRLPSRRLLTLSLPAAIAFTLGEPSAPSATSPVTVSADSPLLASYRWRNIGPDRGGRSIAVTGVKGRPNEAYFGATGGGLWKTTDGGENWTAVTDG